MQVQIPDGNVAVPLPMFAVIYNEAQTAFRAQPGPYLAGVVAALRWIAGVEDKPPLTVGAEATPDAIWREVMAADAIYFGWPDADPRVDRRFGTGVSVALHWAMGHDVKPPVMVSAA